MELKSYLEDTRKVIDKMIPLVLQEQKDKIWIPQQQLKYILEKYDDQLTGGKRIRGMLVILGYEMSGEKRNPEIIKAACAIEILHTSLLIHDDIIDRSPLRRGKPTLNQSLGADHFALSQSICLGDLGFFAALTILTALQFSPSKKMKAIELFSRMVSKTVIGESLDISLAKQARFCQEDVVTLQLFKTAYYTIILPLSLGALLAGCSQSRLQSIEEFGSKIGSAYQIQDDLLGVFGDESVLGKSATSDIEEGKVTLLLSFLLANGTEKQKETVKNLYGKKGLKRSELELVRDIFVKTNARDFCEHRIGTLSSQARQITGKLTHSKRYQDLLNQLIYSLASRVK